MIFLRAFVVWLAIIAVETVHGTIRVAFIAPAIGDLRSRQVGVFVGSALILGVVTLLICWLRARSTGQILLVGLFWAVLTFGFEMALGMLLGLSNERIFEDYDLRNGGLMPIGLLFLILSPLIASRLRKCGDA